MIWVDVIVIIIINIRIKAIPEWICEMARTTVMMARRTNLVRWLRWWWCYSGSADQTLKWRFYSNSDIKGHFIHSPWLHTRRDENYTPTRPYNIYLYLYIWRHRCRRQVRQNKINASIREGVCGGVFGIKVPNEFIYHQMEHFIHLYEHFMRDPHRPLSIQSL